MTGIRSPIVLDTDGFVDQVQSLPAEIYNEIYDLTFTPEFPDTYTVDRNYRPPSILQVNRHFRSMLSSTFYSTTIFKIPNDPAKSFKDNRLYQWLKSLTSQQRKHLISTVTELWILWDVDAVKGLTSGTNDGTGMILNTRVGNMTPRDRTTVPTVVHDTHDTFEIFGWEWADEMSQYTRFVAKKQDGTDAIFDCCFLGRSEYATEAVLI